RISIFGHGALASGWFDTWWKPRSMGSCHDLSSDLPVARANPLVGGQFLEAHRAARAHFVGADADLRAHPEFGTVGETGRGIPVNGGRIDFGQKLFGVRLVCRDDAVGMRRAVVVDVVDGLLHPRHDADGQNGVVVFSKVVLLRGGTEAGGWRRTAG